MKRLRILVIIVGFLCLPIINCVAQDFIYQPKNPAFGGNYMNYSWLLNSANAQNKIEEKTPTSSYRGREYDPFSNFEQDIERRFFSELSSQIVNSYFGEEGGGQSNLEEGTYQFGNYNIDIVPGQEGLNITINDISTGGESVITIPYY
ncbi:MAG: curli production assembly/transport component CsgF [Bacteroidales bacterium]